MNRRPSDEQLGNLLKTPHFGQGGELPASDPIAPTPMLLTLNQVKPYDRNPRRERNPLFDDIKDSIRNQGGLNNPLTVTRRPGEEIYMVESGGNTRLQILYELFQETGQETFNQIHVLYRPWRSETHVLTAHLIENEKRGEMLFIDKALGIRALKELFEAEDGSEPYSIRKLADRLKAVGYSINLDLLSRMNYTIDVLLPLIPEALRAGMGRPQVARIRKIEKAFLHYWTQISKQEASIFDELFQDCLLENNRPEWDADALRQTLEDRMTELLDIPIRTLRLDIDALLRGREIEITQPPEESPWEEEISEQHSTDAVDNNTLGSTLEIASSNPTTEQEETTPETTTEPSIQVDPPVTTETSHSFENEEPISVATLGIADLRRSAYETAHQLAACYQLEQCIQASNDWGLGFLVDLPEQPLIPDSSQGLDAKQRWQQMVRQWIWWLLYVCSEATVRPERIPNLPESMSIRGLCLEGNQAELMRRIGQPAWISLSYQLLADPLVPDEHFHKLITLIRHCRTLRQQIGNDSDDPLWLERNDYAQS